MSYFITDDMLPLFTPTAHFLCGNIFFSSHKARVVWFISFEYRLPDCKVYFFLLVFHLISGMDFPLVQLFQSHLPVPLLLSWVRVWIARQTYGKVYEFEVIISCWASKPHRENSTTVLLKFVFHPSSRKSHSHQNSILGE